MAGDRVAGPVEHPRAGSEHCLAARFGAEAARTQRHARHQPGVGGGQRRVLLAEVAERIETADGAFITAGQAPMAPAS